MAALSSHPASSTAKILGVGNSGLGKTGALASLAKAGYNLRILDNDNGCEILAQLLDNDKPALARVDVETHVDEYSEQGGVLRPKTPLKGFSGSMKVLTEWPGHGKPSTWGPDTVLVWDSMTLGGKFIMNHVLNMAGKLASGQPPSQPDWGSAITLQEHVLSGLYGLKCHVIVLAHLRWLEVEGEHQTQAFPSALGKKLPTETGRYFNHTLGFTAVGAGANKKRMIVTNDPRLGCKTSAPGKVKDQYPLETGLADYFKDLGFSPEGKKPA
jgi:hypothetical protein